MVSKDFRPTDLGCDKARDIGYIHTSYNRDKFSGFQSCLNRIYNANGTSVGIK